MKDDEYRFIVTLWNGKEFEFGHSEFERVSVAHAVRCSSTYALDLQVVDLQAKKVIYRITRRGSRVDIPNPAELYKEYVKLTKEVKVTPVVPVIAEAPKRGRGRPRKAPK